MVEEQEGEKEEGQMKKFKRKNQIMSCLSKVDYFYVLTVTRTLRILEHKNYINLQELFLRLSLKIVLRVMANKCSK